MDLNNIQGFDNLSETAKAIFIRVYAKHRNAVEDKDDWIAVKVEDHISHLKVYFKNGKWLHYIANGSWY